MKNNKLSKTLIFALTFGFVLTVGVLGRWIYLKRVTRNQFVSKSLPSPTTTADSQSKISTDWKTYRNEDQRFELEYPSQYSPTLKGGGTYLQKEGEATLMYLKILTNDEGLTAREWFDQQCPCVTKPLLETHELTDFEINGYPALKLTKKDPVGTYQDFFIIFSANQKIYHFSFSPKKEDLDIANQVISSLKFF